MTAHFQIKASLLATDILYRDLTLEPHDQLRRSKQRPYYDLAMFENRAKVRPKWSLQAVRCP